MGQPEARTGSAHTPGGAGTDADAAGMAGPPDSRILRTHRDVLSAALQLFADEGWDGLTHQRLARAAGYSRATLHKHWPTRADLLRDAISLLGHLGHRGATGDLRADLIAELTALRSVMAERRLDRALAVVGDLAGASPALAEVRDKLVVDTERVLRELLATRVAGEQLDAATRMLAGALLQSALLHGRLPDDALLAAGVDLVLGGLGAG